LQSVFVVVVVVVVVVAVFRMVERRLWGRFSCRPEEGRRCGERFFILIVGDAGEEGDDVVVVIIGDGVDCKDGGIDDDDDNDNDDDDDDGAGRGGV